MGNFGLKDLRITFDIVMVLLYLHQLSSAALPNKISVYTAKASKCSADILIKKGASILSQKSVGKVDCLRLCVARAQCGLVVYQEYSNGTSSCLQLLASGNSSAALDLSASKKCLILTVNPCLNGGTLYEEVCICQEGFAGESCEIVSPSSCKVTWTQAAYYNGNTVYTPLITHMGRNIAKVRYRNRDLGVVSFLKGMISDYVSSYWYLMSFQFFEKTAWNRFATDPQRLFMNFWSTGSYEVLKLSGTKKYTSVVGVDNISFLCAKEPRFSVTRRMPDDWSSIENDLALGHEICDSSWTNVDYQKQLVVIQATDRQLGLYVKENFVKPPKMYSCKIILGVGRYCVTSLMNSGGIYENMVQDYSNIYNLNPCWTRITEVKYNSSTAATSWKELGIYLRSGNDVRINIGTVYYKVIEVMQIGDSFTFLLAPFLSQNNTKPFTASLYGVRALVSSSAMFESCSHVLQGEEVVEHSRHESSYGVVWYVDIRQWTKVFSVFSNSSVASGSLDDLVSGINNGSDVRIWITLLKTNLSRFMDTHMTSITDDGKVSTESVVTWRTTTDAYSSVSLSPACDLEYVMVTSDGYMEILSFNVWTSAKSRVETDALITWFLS